MIDLPYFNQCQNIVDSNILFSIAKVESSLNPNAIAIVGSNKKIKKLSKKEAIEFAKTAKEKGKNISLGLMQINISNFKKYNMSIDNAFNPCFNIKIGAKIYDQCLKRAKKSNTGKIAREKAFSCYYSGNFKTGFYQDKGLKNSYVERVNKFLIDKKKSFTSLSWYVFNSNKKGSNLHEKRKNNEKSPLIF